MSEEIRKNEVDESTLENVSGGNGVTINEYEARNCPKCGDIMIPYNGYYVCCNKNCLYKELQYK